MAYKVIILYQLYMPSYFLGTFTEYPYLMSQKNEIFVSTSVKYWPITNKNWSYRKKFCITSKLKMLNLVE